MNRSRFVSITAAVAAASALGRAAAMDQTPDFQFGSRFWINLHHRLLRASELRYRSKAGDFVIPAEYRRLVAVPVPARERQAWDAAVDAYLRRYGAAAVESNAELIAADTGLSAILGPDIPSNARVATPILDAMRTAAPVFKKYLWLADDASNARWIANTKDDLSRYGSFLRSEIPRLFHTPWRAYSYRVDVVLDATFPSEYSLDGGSFWQIVMSSSDPDTRDLAAIELLLHEATHSIVFADRGAVGGEIVRAARAARRRPPEDLWHALIFYTTGRLMERVARSDGRPYTMFGVTENIFSDTWAPYWPAFVNHWEPYMKGRGTLRDALQSCVDAVYAAG